MQRVKVPAGYQCPLCPDHSDSVFSMSKITGSPICEGCSMEISHFIEQDERSDDKLLDRLEELTGLTFREYKKAGFEECIEEFERRLDPEIVEQEARFEMEATHRSLDEVVQGWRNLIDFYRAEIKKLG